MSEDIKVSVIIAAAGSGKRMGGGVNKQYIVIDGMPVLARSAAAFERNPRVDEIVICVRAGEEDRCRREIVEKYGFRKVAAVVAGGGERQDSVRAALAAVSEDCTHVLVHDGARPLVSDAVTGRVIGQCIASGAAVPGVPLKDTVKIAGTDGVSGGVPVVETTPDRSRLYAVQTPQGFEKSLLEDAFAALDRRIAAGDSGAVVTDDASIVEAYGHPVFIVEGEDINFKITTPDDVRRAEYIFKCEEKERGEAELPDIGIFPRTGFGYDVHAFSEDRKLILGGVDIPYSRGLAGHSDADVLVHAIMDSLLGACAMGDIGKHFPDTDPAYKGADSLVLLNHVGKLLADGGWRIVNIDATVIAQKPKIAPYIETMKKNISEVLKISGSQINIKGTTTERLGFTGREEGIAAQSAATIIHD